jgi:hypothetical protein
VAVRTDVGRERLAFASVGCFVSQRRRARPNVALISRAPHKNQAQAVEDRIFFIERTRTSRILASVTSKGYRNSLSNEIWQLEPRATPELSSKRVRRP